MKIKSNLKSQDEIPDYHELKRLLSLAHEMNLLSSKDEINIALMARDGVILEQQERKTCTYRHYSSDVKECRTSDDVEIDYLFSEKTAIAYKLMYRLNQLQLNLNIRNASFIQQVNSALDILDAKLCLKWGNIELDDTQPINDSAQNMLEHLDRINGIRLASARAAELLAASYFSDLGFTVNDVSVKQLNGDQDDWKSYDLIVGDKYVDVKNSRCSKNGGGKYVEHCVPLFKSVRRDKKHVQILGVVSPYQSKIRDYFDGNLKATILGEVNIVDVRDLYSWSKVRFKDKLSLDGIWGNGYLPGWIFEYCNEHYPKRSTTLEEFSTLAGEILTHGARIIDLPDWLQIFRPDTGESPLESSVESLIRRDLRSLHLTIGISRRSLFVYAMGISIEALLNREPPEIYLNTLKSHLTIKNCSNFWGLDDPLQYFENLTESLIEAGKNILSLRMELVQFHLAHPSILFGILANGEKIRILAYCGGYFDSVPCGNPSLTLGVDETCRICGYLVCGRCGTCSPKCSAIRPRIAELIAKGRPGNPPKLR